MNATGPRPRKAPRSPLFGPLIAINAGILAGLLCGANGPHPNLPIAIAGAAVALAGVAAVVRALVLQRRGDTTGARWKR